MKVGSILPLWTEHELRPLGVPDGILEVADDFAHQVGVAPDYPSKEPIHLYVDALTMMMVKRPESFEVPDMKHGADIQLGTHFRPDLYVNFRLVKALRPAALPAQGETEKDVDFVFFRENTEGANVGVGGNFKEGMSDEVAVQDEIHNWKGGDVPCARRSSTRWPRARRRVCMSDKANVMPFGYDLWQRMFGGGGPRLSEHRAEPSLRRCAPTTCSATS